MWLQAPRTCHRCQCSGACMKMSSARCAAVSLKQKMLQCLWQSVVLLQNACQLALAADLQKSRDMFNSSAGWTMGASTENV